MAKILLRLLMLFKPIYRKMGLDVRQLEVILSVKLICDDRTVTRAFGKKQKKSTNSMLIFSFITYLFLGLIVMSVVLLTPDRFTAYGLSISVYTFLLSFIAMNDFSTILFDTRDQYIILPKPVSDRTLTISRLLHMAIRVMTVGLAVGLPLLVYTLVKLGVIASLGLIVTLLLAGFVGLLMVSLFYLLVLRWLPTAKVKKSITNTHIGVTIFIILLAYIGPKLINLDGLVGLRLIDEWWLWLLLSAWPVGWLELAVGNVNMVTLGLSLFSLVLPFAALYLIQLLFSKGFTEKIFALAQADPVEKEKHSKAMPLSSRIAGICTQGGSEEASFLHVWYMTARSHKLRMQLLPSLLYVPVFFVYLIFFNGEEKSFDERLGKLVEFENFIIIYYLTVFPLFNVLSLTTRSDAYKSAWIYYVVPIKSDGEVVSGALKAVIVKYYLNFMLILLLISIAIFGFRVLNDILFASMLGIIFTIVLALFSIREFPFSVPEGKVSSRSMLAVVTMGGVSLFGLLHFQIHKVEWLIWLAAMAATGVAHLMFKYLKREHLIRQEVIEVER